MTVVNMPKRPTVSNPVLKNQALANALSSIDDHLGLLRCAADSAALVEATDEQLVSSLYFLHGKLRAELDKVFSLT